RQTARARHMLTSQSSARDHLVEDNDRIGTGGPESLNELVVGLDKRLPLDRLPVVIKQWE
ncbi:MAG: hypothetical protein WD049_00495, partial [Candidatus Paceibacterota bacterium]